MSNQSFNPKIVEKEVLALWDKHQLGTPDQTSDKPRFCMMVPPPNVTGSLHLGHALQNALMDTVVRYQRYCGKNVLLQAGTDHAGIATQMVVERQLNEKGIEKKDLSRDEFVAHIWDWVKQSGGTITSQMRQMGTSVDWETERFTLDEGISHAVRTCFISLYEQGLIYRGKRLVNWDTKLLTAVSDLEVINESRSGQIWHIKYPIDADNAIIVATTRPETLLGDQAICVHPEDERYQHLIGTTVELPLCERRIPIIADTHVDPEFGTGAVKVTPAHDFNDYEIGKRHELAMLNILNPDGSLNDACPAAYQGLDRQDARKKIVADLTEQGLLDKVEPHTAVLPIGDRSMTVLEPMLTDQWFMSMTEMASDGLKALKDGELNFVPSNWDKTYALWLEDIQDWCISRQLVWGHRIPAFYDEDGNVYVGHDEESVRKANPNLGDLRQDNDVLDTWFSSALWPFATLGWPEKTERYETFYPNQLLVTGFDIIFFWVARMVMLGIKLTGKTPFSHVFVTGLIRDEKGQKMSKSKGNVLDPLDLINGIGVDELIAKRTAGLMQPAMRDKIKQNTLKIFPEGIEAHGTDALRFTLLHLCTHGRDIKFDLNKLKASRNFCNKIWNAAKLIQMVECTEEKNTSLLQQSLSHQISVLIKQCDKHLADYRFDLYATALYDFFWHQYCDWYLECLKATKCSSLKAALEQAFDDLMVIYHPALPFITEALWQARNEASGSISQQAYPLNKWQEDQAAMTTFSKLQTVISGIRAIRSELNISPSQLVDVYCVSDANELIANNQELISALAKVENMHFKTASSTSCAFIADDIQVAVELKGLIEAAQENARLDKKIKKKQAEIDKLDMKMSQPKYKAKAPQALQESDKAQHAQLGQELETLKQYHQALEGL